MQFANTIGATSLFQVGADPASWVWAPADAAARQATPNIHEIRSFLIATPCSKRSTAAVAPLLGAFPRIQSSAFSASALPPRHRRRRAAGRGKLAATAQKAPKPESFRRHG